MALHTNMLMCLTVIGFGLCLTVRVVDTSITNSVSISKKPSCDKALAECFRNTRCRTTLENLLDSVCKDLFSNFNYFSSESSKISCPRQCRHQLKRAKRGPLKNLLTCKISKSEYFPYQDRAERCIAGKIKKEIHDNYVTNGCSKIFETCTMYSGCRRRYEEMMYQCSDMVRGKQCSSTCEKAVRRFLVSKHTKGFFQCKCDGAFYFQKTCHSLKKNILKLCVSKAFKRFLHKRQVVSIS